MTWLIRGMVLAGSADWPLSNPFEKPQNTLQFSANGHLLAFKTGQVIVAAADKALKIEFIGANAVNPSAKEITSVSAADKPAPLNQVIYANLWDGVSLQYEKNSDGVAKSTYYISPNHASAVEKIRLHYNRPVQLATNGDLLVGFPNGRMTESRPVAWQEADGVRIPVKAEYKSLGTHEIGFEVSEYTPSLPLIIDPIMSWNTFMGSAGGDDFIFATAVDLDGNIYVGGYSNATWGAPINSYTGGNDGFVAKLNSSGVRQWNTFMG
ncbi:MAG: hypothetical protein HQK55_12820, partial [Deltaproteobacteria bacterium]|nr:hypothetical protein [Deltaproteobacteria bacterium]